MLNVGQRSLPVTGQVVAMMCLLTSSLCRKFVLQRYCNIGKTCEQEYKAGLAFASEHSMHRNSDVHVTQLHR